MHLIQWDDSYSGSAAKIPARARVLISDPTLARRHLFTTIASVGWEDCVALQPADLLAYENFKEGFRNVPGATQRKRRAIFTEIHSLDSFGANLRMIDREDIARLRSIFAAAEARRNAQLNS
jgi:hypothetical protein